MRKHQINPNYEVIRKDVTARAGQQKEIEKKGQNRVDVLFLKEMIEGREAGNEY